MIEKQECAVGDNDNLQWLKETHKHLAEKW